MEMAAKESQKAALKAAVCPFAVSQNGRLEDSCYT